MTSNEYMFHLKWSPWTQLMACHMFGAKPLHKPILTNFQYWNFIHKLQWCFSLNMEFSSQKMHFKISKLWAFDSDLDMLKCIFENRELLKKPNKHEKINSINLLCISETMQFVANFSNLKGFIASSNILSFSETHMWRFVFFRDLPLQSTVTISPRIAVWCAPCN